MQDHKPKIQKIRNKIKKNKKREEKMETRRCRADSELGLGNSALRGAIGCDHGTWFIDFSLDPL